MVSPLQIPTRSLSPVRLLAVLLLLIFVAEAVAMLLLDATLPGDLPAWAESLLDAGLLTAVCVPFLWRYYLRPLKVSLEGETGKAQAVMNTAADGIVVIDERGIVQCFNSAAEKIFGYTEAEMVGGTLNRLMPSPDRERHDGYIARYLATGEAHIVDTVRVVEGMRKDGTVFPMELAVSEVPLSSNRRLFTGIVRDVSERRQAEEALRQAHEQLEAIFCNIPAMVAYLDADFNFIRVNRAYAEADGRSPEFFVGRNHFALYPSAENEAIFRQTVASGEPYVAYGRPFEYSDHPERGVRYWDWVLHPVKAADGQVQRLVLTLVDVTERKQLQAVDALFPEINQQVLRGMKLEELLNFICSEVVRLFDVELALVGRKEPDGAVAISAWSGIASGYQRELERIGVRWDDTPQGKGPAGEAIRSGQVRSARVDESTFELWHEAAERYGLKSAVCIPLVIRREVYGVFLLYSRRAATFEDPNTVRRLMAVSGRISMAVEAAMDQQRLLLLGGALSAAGNAVFITDRQGRIEWINDAFTRLSGYTSEEAIGGNPRILNSGLQDPAYYRALWQTILGGQVWSRETTERRKDGSFYTVHQTITPSGIGTARSPTSSRSTRTSPPRS
jgi:PAS domain S-box-containing protein